MARVNEVKKSRKEQTCSCCGKVIPVGNPYKWISFNYGPTIVRCNSCGFKPYETTSNEYLKEVGRIQYEYSERLSECTSVDELNTLVQDLVGELEAVRDDLEGRIDNLPEQFQYSGPGEVIQERLDNIESVLSDLDCVYIEFEPTSYREWLTDNYEDNDEEYEERLSKYSESEDDPDYLEAIEEEESDKLEELTDEVSGYLDNLEC